MIFNKSGSILLVSPDIFPLPEFAAKKKLKHLTSVERLFPVINETLPDIILFDYDNLSDDMEKVLRRLRSNSFYNKIKICCYRSSPHTKTDGFLKALGVDQLIYKNVTQNNTNSYPTTSKAAPEAIITEFKINVSVA